jgi:twitching motility protein PilT
MENRDFEIRDAIEKGREHYKSQSFDQSLLELYNEGIISKEEAKRNATSASDLELKMSGLTDGQASSSDGSATKASNVSSNDDVFELK